MTLKDYYLHNPKTGEAYGPYPSRKFAEQYKEQMLTADFNVIDRLTEEMIQWRLLQTKPT